MELYDFFRKDGTKYAFPITFDPLTYHYTSRRNVVYAANGMVCTGNPLAAQAGLDVLRRGGNAIDAAVAAASTLTVVEPTANGIGSDAFAIVYTGGKLYGLNSSGPSPQSISLQEVRARGFEQMPEDGVIPVNVPGAPGAWAALSQRFGRMPLTETMASRFGMLRMAIRLNRALVLGGSHPLPGAKRLRKNFRKSTAGLNLCTGWPSA